MAIPFNLPTDDETEEAYRRLDQLLLDLYDVLRLLLRIRRLETVHFPAASAAPTPSQAVPAQVVQQVPVAVVQQPPQPELPDVVPAVLARKPPVPPPRRRRRRAENKVQQQGTRQQQQQARMQQQQAVQQPQPGLLNVGIELRQIAEVIRSTEVDGGFERRRKEIKASSLFSLLVPASLTAPIWTTVIILVGWRLLARRCSP